MAQAQAQRPSRGRGPRGTLTHDARGGRRVSHGASPQAPGHKRRLPRGFMNVPGEAPRERCKMKGRKPKPAALHDLHGDPSHLRARHLAPRRAVEPVTRAGDLTAPEDFTEAQRDLWDDAIAS